MLATECGSTAKELGKNTEKTLTDNKQTVMPSDKSPEHEYMKNRAARYPYTKNQQGATIDFDHSNYQIFKNGYTNIDRLLLHLAGPRALQPTKAAAATPDLADNITLCIDASHTT